jgi:hypothetical protein
MAKARTATLTQLNLVWRTKFSPHRSMTLYLLSCLTQHRILSFFQWYRKTRFMVHVDISIPTLRKHGKCTKNYKKKKKLKEKQTGNDGYPLCRGRAPEDCGFTSTLKIAATQKYKSTIDGSCNFRHCCQKYFRLTSTWSIATV